MNKRRESLGAITQEAHMTEETRNGVTGLGWFLLLFGAIATLTGVWAHEPSRFILGLILSFSAMLNIYAGSEK